MRENPRRSPDRGMILVDDRSLFARTRQDSLNQNINLNQKRELCNPQRHEHEINIKLNQNKNKEERSWSEKLA